MKKILNYINYIVLAFLAFIALALILSNLDNPLGFRVFNVQSGSMEPSIKVGSLVFVKPEATYNVDDVVTYRSQKTIKDTFTHRIIQVEQDPDIGKLIYKTKGDANEDVDISPVFPEQVLGKVFLVIPLIGYPLAFAKTQLGFIILVVVPATLIIYSEAGNIRKEVTQMFEQKKKEEKEVAVKGKGKKDTIKT